MGRIGRIGQIGRIGRIGHIGRIGRAWTRIRQDYVGQAHTIKAEASLHTPKLWRAGPQGRRYTRGSAAVIDRRCKITGPAVGCYLSIHGGHYSMGWKRVIRTVGTK
jgi:hypothetical protein